jgi:hypothetical protein
MAMFEPIPLPKADNPQFKDVMDYLETIRQRKGKQAQFEQEQQRLQDQFGQTKQLEMQKLAELAKYHQATLNQNESLNPLKVDLLKARIEALKNSGSKLSPQEKTQSMKILESGRSLKSMVDKANKIDELLDTNPDLTGILQGASSSLNLSNNEKLAEFDQRTRKLQADMARYGSQRGGVQALKWAERSKPGVYRTHNYNKGMIKSIQEDAQSDYNELKQEYEDLTGKPYPISLSEMKIENSSSQPKITKEHVTEENILHTMKETGLSRDQVMQKLKERGLA